MTGRLREYLVQDVGLHTTVLPVRELFEAAADERAVRTAEQLVRPGVGVRDPALVPVCSTTRWASGARSEASRAWAWSAAHAAPSGSGAVRSAGGQACVLGKGGAVWGNVGLDSV